MAKRKRGPGRPHLGVRKRSRLISVKLTEREYAAIAARVAAENDEMAADLPETDPERKPITVAAWVREQVLDALGLSATLRSDT